MQVPVRNNFTQRRGKKRVYFLVASITCCAAMFAGLNCLAEEPASKTHVEGKTVIAFGGDVMVPANVGEAETARFLSGLAGTFSKADAAFVNLEGPIGGNPEDAKNCDSEDCHLSLIHI